MYSVPAAALQPHPPAGACVEQECVRKGARPSSRNRPPRLPCRNFLQTFHTALIIVCHQKMQASTSAAVAQFPYLHAYSSSPARQACQLSRTHLCPMWQSGCTPMHECMPATAKVLRTQQAPCQRYIALWSGSTPIWLKGLSMLAQRVVASSAGLWATRSASGTNTLVPLSACITTARLRASKLPGLTCTSAPGCGGLPHLGLC
jgi:hypothetical protein